MILLEVLSLGDSFDMVSCFELPRNHNSFSSSFHFPQGENEILLLNVIPENQFTGKIEKPVDEDMDDGSFGRKGRSLYETFYVVLVYKQRSSPNSMALTKMWKIIFSANMNAVIGGS